MDSNPVKHRSRRKKRRWPVVLLILLILTLLAVAGVMFRMAGWRGQRTEGTLTALVNPWNSVDAAGYKPTLVKVRDTQVDQSCAAALEQMLLACEAAGNTPVLSAGYLSRSELERNRSLSLENGEPGFSEHETGLAVDIQDRGDPNSPESAVTLWLRENAWSYGFILRYPDGTEEITGMVPCPWHYRYVGEAAASQIHQLNITLEEYVTMFYNDSAAVVFE